MIALGAAVLVTLVVWGSWMALAFILGAVGWALSSVGSLLQSITSRMTAAREIVLWVSLGSGVLLAALLAFDVPLDRIRAKFRRSRPVGEQS